MTSSADPRNLRSGLPIPSEGYCDQPYVVQTDDGAWLCCMTTGPGKEGQAGQHVVAMRSADRGRTWSPPVDVEPGNGPEASYSVMLKVPGGRIYCFYNYNSANIRQIPADDPPYPGGLCSRVDSLGDFVFRYTDDGGRTWSARRWTVPIREFTIDRENACGGEVRFGWNVGRPFVLDGTAYVSFHKVGGFGEGFFTRSEGVLLACDNLLAETDPDSFRWRTLPDGDAGLRAPAGGGPIAEEQSYVTLGDGSIYAIYRTTAGRPACAASRDGGRTWSEPRFECYADGRPIRHPRAANFVWKCANGRFLYWFHNNAWTGYNFGPGAGSRNVAWLCGGVEQDGRILWSQPEVALYDPDFLSGPSYPDLVEEADGRRYLIATQKTAARVHELDAAMVEGLWGQFQDAAVARDGLLLDLPAGGAIPPQVAMPELPRFVTRDYWSLGPDKVDLGGGFTLDLWLRLRSLQAGQVVMDTRTESGAGLALVTTARGTLELVLNDGRSECRWDCDAGELAAGRPQHVVVIVDAGPRIIAFVTDGRLNDGGGRRTYGWGRFSPALGAANGSPTLSIAPDMAGDVLSLRLYGRPLRISEAVGNWRAEAMSNSE